MTLDGAWPRLEICATVSPTVALTRVEQQVRLMHRVSEMNEDIVPDKVSLSDLEYLRSDVLDLPDKASKLVLTAQENPRGLLVFTAVTGDGTVSLSAGSQMPKPGSEGFVRVPARSELCFEAKNGASRVTFFAYGR